MTDLGDQPVSSRDRQILRELAQHVRDISQHPRMAQSRARWFQTNRLQLTRPPVQISLDGASDDFVPPQTLCCEDAAARAAEYRFRCFIAYHERLRCDTLIQARWQVPQVFHDTGWGLAIQHKASTQEKGAWALIRSSTNRRISRNCGFLKWFMTKPLRSAAWQWYTNCSATSWMST